MKLNWWLFYILLLLAGLGVRLFQVTQSPPSPYWEEVALGYDAYSILKTGSDHHGNAWPIVAFESFGDWKPSGYFYALVPFIKTFGLSVLAVRLPSVMAGVGIVAGLGALMRQLTKRVFKPKERRWLIATAIFVGLISPWLIQFSRAAWEVNLATFFIVWGVVFGLQAVKVPQRQKKRFIWLGLSIVLLFAAMYSYHSTRVLAPALGLMIGWQFLWRDLRAKRKNIWLVGYILPIFLTVLLLNPFTAVIGTPALGQRLAETSIFSDLSVIEESNDLKALNDNSLLSRVIYHRYVLFGGKIFSQFISHFRADFLFTTGDLNARHSSQYFGLLYPFEIIFLLVGAWWILKRFAKQHQQLLAVWLVIGILPSAMSVGVPHALRILPVAPLFLLAIALGIWQTAQWLKSTAQKIWPPIKRVSWLWCLGLIVLYLVSFAGFYRHLLLVYPQRFSSEWQYGYQQLMAAVEGQRAAHPDLPIFITRGHGRPAMYYWFYIQTDPKLVQAANQVVEKDQGEYLEFENLRFVRNLGEVTATPAIIAGSPEEISRFEDKIILTEISNLQGQVIWQVAYLTSS